MTQIEQLNVPQDLFPFSNLDGLSARLTQENPVRGFRNIDGLMELPVNNYLKTPEEIDMEFRYGINPRKLNLKRENLHDFTSITTTDGYLNIHNLDEALSGFMEENY